VDGELPLHGLTIGSQTHRIPLGVIMLARTARLVAVPLMSTRVTGSLLVATPAVADSDAVIRTGSCSATTDWKTKAKLDNGRIEVEGEVDSNRNGQTWHWTIRQNGTMAARGTGVTAGRSGSFSIERHLRNTTGTDMFVFRAMNPATGEVCRGTGAF
jgi:hypothetical protein